jgi:hypothetical protein
MGNSAMSNSNDVAHALIDVASSMLNNRYARMSQELSGKISDQNGNTCGEYSLQKE